MASIFRLSPANPLQFFNQVEVFGNVSASTASLNVLNPNYNNFEFDTHFFRSNIKPWLMQKGYASPWQINDVAKVQWVGKDYSSLGLGEDYICYLLDKDGNTVKTLSVGTDIKYTDLAGGTESVYLASCLLWDVEEGVYFLQLFKRGSFSEPDYWLISEPLEVREQWSNTSLVRYKNSRNDYGLYYDMTTVTVCFQRRFFGYLTEFTPQSQFEVYENDPRDLTMLGGDAYRGWTFTVSAKYGVPDWEKDKLERIFLHDDVTVDGRSVTRESGAKVEVAQINGTALSNVSIKLREKDSEANLDVPNLGGVIEVYNEPQSKNFYVHRLMFQGTTPINIKKFFTSKARFLAYINNYLLSTYTHWETKDTMFMGIDARGKIVLRTSDQTIFDDYSGTVIDKILQSWVKLHTHPLVGIYDTIITSLTIPSGTHYYCVFKDDNTELEAYTTVTGNTNVTRTSPSDETYYVFFDYATVVGFSGDNILQELNGELPPQTTTLECELNVLNIIDGDWFNLGTGGINAINLFGNLLNTTSVNKILLAAYEGMVSGKIAQSGSRYIDLTGGTNSAPSADAKIYVSKLVAAGWTVIHN